MKKTLKFFAWTLGSIVVMLAVIAMAIPLLFDPNDHKDRIAELAWQHTGRDLKIEGNIALSIFPWLGVRLPKVEIGNAPGFPDSVFARVDEIQVRVKLLPLIAKRLEMDTLSVRGLVVNLARREDGVSNFDDLVALGGAEADPGRSDAGAAVVLAVGGLDIQGAAINWRDRQRNERYGVSGLNVRTGPLTPDAPVEFMIAFDMEGDGASVRGHVTSSGSVRIAANGSAVHAEDVAWQARFQGDTLPGGRMQLDGRTNASFDTESHRLSLEGLELDGSDLMIADRPGTISVKGSLAGDLNTQELRLPDLAVVADLGGGGDQAEDGTGVRLDASADVSVNLNSGTLTVQSLVFAIPELDLGAVNGALSGSADVSIDLESLSYSVSAAAANGTLSGDALQQKQVGFELKGAIDGSIATGIHEAQDFSLSSVVSGPDFPAGELTANVVADVHIDTNQRALNAKNLRLETAGVTATGNLSARELAGTPRLNGTLATELFDPREVLERLGVRLPAAADSKVLQSASIKTDFSASAGSAKLERTVLALDDSRISGYVAIEGVESPALDFDVTVDRIDLDRYLPRPAAAEVEVRATSAPGVAATPSVAAASAMTITEETLRGLNATGRLKAGRLKVGGVALSDVRVAVEAKEGLVKAAPLSAKFYGGSYRGDARVDARGNVMRISLDDRFTGVRLDKLLHDLKIDPQGMDFSGSTTVALEATATGDAGSGLIRVDEINLNAQLGGKSFQNGKLTIAAKGRLDLDLAKHTLNSEQLEIRVGELVTRSTFQITNLLGDPGYRGTLKADSFNPRSLLRQLGQDDIVTADPKALSKAEFEARINGTKSSVNVELLAVTLDRSRLDGTLGVANFTDPAIRFDAKIDDLDADRYLPPQSKGNQAPAGTPGAALSVVPTEALRNLNLDGRLEIARMKIGNLRLSDIRVTAKAKDGIVNLHPLGANLYEGKYTGNVRVDARGKQPVLRLDERLEQVRLGRLLQDVRGEQPVTGMSDVHAMLTATGPDAETLKRTLSGTTRFELSNGEVKGLDLIGQLCALASTLSLTSFRREDLIAGILQQALPREARMADGTSFTDLSGTINFADGRATNDDLVLTSPVLDFGGSGSMNLTSLAVDYRGIARLSGSCADRVGRSFRELRGADIPVHISGLASRPKVDANLAGLLLQATGGGGDRQERAGQPQAATRPQLPPDASGQESGQQQPPPAPPTQDQLIRGLLEQLLK